MIGQQISHYSIIEKLGEGIEDMAEWRAALNVDPRFAPLSDDSRFAGMLERLGL